MVSLRILLAPLRKALAACGSSARRLIRDRGGVAAVEFALILPLLLIVMIGTAETTSALNYKRKISQVAFSMADLVSQSSSLSSGDISDIMVAARAIMEPFPSDGLTVVIAGVSFDSNSKASVDWSVNQTGGTPWSKGSVPPVTFPAGTARPGTSLIIGRASNTYIPLFASMAQSIFPRAAEIFMEDTYFLLPRLSDKVTFN
ncbi:TadE/TadG family type IV pilus assembly protein [Pannonibacter phragmitetus]|uniref:TadE/TadG family type IV pilus assembly protein n=1 Tax=Pannonibacter phragmitetus TaxID=121719 RepID=UPI000F0233F3|nr:TadE/TadG family type IV pilus assembly protein [Pannonibacter phragmitetus]